MLYFVFSYCVIKKNGLHTLIDRFHTEKSNLNTVFCSLFRMNTNN